MYWTSFYFIDIKARTALLWNCRSINIHIATKVELKKKKSVKILKIYRKEAYYFQFLRKPYKVTYGTAKLLKNPNKNPVLEDLTIQLRTNVNVKDRNVSTL